MVAAVLLAAFLAPSQAATPEDDARFLRSFFSQYCQRCHNGKKASGGQDFEALAFEMRASAQLEQWQTIVDALNFGAMPPSIARKRPAPDEVQRVVDWATQRLVARREQLLDEASSVTFRRLSNFEYQRTIRDLLGLELHNFDPTQKEGEFSIPDSEREGGFDNLAATSAMSDHLLDNYLAAAEEVIQRATNFGAPPRKIHHRHSFGEALAAEYRRLEAEAKAAEVELREAQARLESARRDLETAGSRAEIELARQQVAATEKVHDQATRRRNAARRRRDDTFAVPLQPYRLVHEGPEREQGGFVSIPRFVDHPLPAGGTYRVKVRVSAHHRFEYSRYQPYPSQERLRLAVYSSPHGTGNHGRPGARDAKMAQFEVPADGAIHEYSCEIYIAKDSAPRFAWDNGRILFFVPYATRVCDQVAETERAEQELGRKLTSPELARLVRRLVFTDLKTPHLRLYDCEVEGPLGREEWPPRGHQLLYGDSSREEIKRLGDGELRRRLVAFCTQAFRRPVEASEVEDFLALIRDGVEAGNSRLEALQLAYQAVLCAPEFLYIESGASPLSDVALASRLSYFLWSSMPDAELMSLARSGELSDPATLESQVARLLADPRSQAFVEHFPEAWLHLYKLGEMPPGPEKFPFYYKGSLEAAMRRETILFFDDLLRRNGSILDFVDSTHTHANVNLARLYGIEGVESVFFEKVALPDRRRGGLLGHASVLTVTANGVDTSPILRGVWVLRNLLGKEPPPPPPDVEPIPPDLRGLQTVKEQLRAHRTAATCNSCHQQMDPLGVALESFDAIGQWRDHYEGNGILDQAGRLTEVRAEAVDPSYHMADGTPYADVIEFKDLLMKDHEQFVRCLTEKLLTYGRGRRLTASDRPTVDGIAEKIRQRGYGLRDLVILVAHALRER